MGQAEVVTRLINKMIHEKVSVQKVSLAGVALGSNLGFHGHSPQDTLADAAQALVNESVQIVAGSRFLRTPAFPPGSGPDYVNAAALLRTSLEPEGLLEHLHAVEAAFARERTARWASRTVDLDLLFHGDAILPDAGVQAAWMALDPARQRTEAPDRLILPHPRLQDRAFVLIPLADIAPLWRHPVTGRTVSEMVAALSAEDMAGICPV